MAHSEHPHPLGIRKGPAAPRTGSANRDRRRQVMRLKGGGEDIGVQRHVRADLVGQVRALQMLQHRELYRRPSLTKSSDIQPVVHQGPRTRGTGSHRSGSGDHRPLPCCSWPP